MDPKLVNDLLAGTSSRLNNIRVYDLNEKKIILKIKTKGNSLHFNILIFFSC